MSIVSSDLEFANYLVHKLQHNSERGFFSVYSFFGLSCQKVNVFGTDLHCSQLTVSLVQGGFFSFFHFSQGSGMKLGNSYYNPFIASGGHKITSQESKFKLTSFL